MDLFKFNPLVSNTITFGPTGYGRSVLTNGAFDIMCKGIMISYFPPCAYDD